MLAGDLRQGKQELDDGDIRTGTRRMRGGSSEEAEVRCHHHKMCSNKSTCNVTCVVEEALSVQSSSW